MSTERDSGPGGPNMPAATGARLLETKAEPGEPLLPRNRTPLSSPDGRWWLMAVAAIVIAGYAIKFLFGSPVGDPSVKKRLLSSWLGWSHVIGGLVAMGLGPFQFLIVVQRRYASIHRWVGRVYVAAIAAGGFGGLWVSKNSLAYPIGDCAFTLLALLWLITAGLGLSTILRGDVLKHREWMIRNFSLTYAAVMLRWQLPLLIFLGLSPSAALTVTSFTSWIPNLVFADWWLKRPKLISS